MTELSCKECGTRFETDRDVGGAGSDTSRCPACGQKHDIPVADGGGGPDEPAATVEADGTTVEIHIHVHKHGG
ncbi:MJ0042-type zinc finger domain-containing protein [Halopelagius inordinatus]|uniref:MJ0042-type zinc finger domain-containing protein n=1 Tax=Halopelagius inordinatus TaxID=553467 RepID=UPI000B81B8E9|nr:MJ0042-type zinc finger domain-containing protein [Halopelagius inordinatus]